MGMGSQKERVEERVKGRQQAALRRSSVLDAEENLGDLTQALDAWTERRLQQLRERAELVRHAFESQLRDAGKDLPRSAWGRIAVRIREQRGERSTPGAFSIEWVTYRYGNTSGGRIYLSDYVKKGDGDRYPKSAFRGLVRDWQRPIVESAEDAFSRIRAAARQVAQVRTQFRAAEKLWVTIEPAQENDG
jgi:hypothetical protein